MAAASSDREISREELLTQLRELGIEPGDVLLVHTSFRAVRPVEGGPLGLIGALRDAVGDAGTLVMPSWGGDDDTPFDRLTTPAAADLGTTADQFWRMPGVLRSDHAFACAASGPRAAEIVADPLPLPPHIPASPVGRVHELKGKVLLLGVGHDANTTLHLAELRAGVPYGVARYCTVVHGEQRLRVFYRENDHCCERFSLADDWLRMGGLLREGIVGHAAARLFRARDVVAEAEARLVDEPLIFLHSPAAGCAHCDEARASVRKR